MKTIAKIIVLISSLFLFSGCTIQLKATEFEGSGGIGHVYRVQGIDGFCWTEEIEGPKLLP